MAAIPDNAREVIDSGRLAHLVTINADGSPQISIVWVGTDGDEIVCAHLSPEQRKLANVRRDPRVSVSIETDKSNAMGLAEYLVIHGTATITEGGAPELLQELAYRYIGPGVKFPPFDAPPGFVMHITPRRFGGVGPWVPGASG